MAEKNISPETFLSEIMIPIYKKRVKFVYLETRNTYKLYARIFQGLVAAVVCFLIVYLTQKRDMRQVTKPSSAKVVHSLKSNLLRDGKYQSTLNFSSSGTDVLIYPLATPQHVKQVDNYEEGLQLYIAKLSFNPSPKSQNLLYLFSTAASKTRHERYTDDHHDPRFDSETLNSPSPEFEAIVTLFAGFSRWSDQKELPYWLAHSNLLGWYWKSKKLSWDTPMNVHVPANILFDMVQLNGTLWSNRFMLLVNDHYKQREYEKGHEVDAIFLDTITGFSIDIYGVSSMSHPLIDNPILHTKTPHSYEFEDIFPLVRTNLDGIPTWRPFNTTKILEKEFGHRGTHALVYLNSRFDSILKDWVTLETCKELYEAYIEPIISGNAPQSEFPRYHWIQRLRGHSNHKCAVVEFTSYSNSRRITALWSKKDKDFKGINDLVLDGARRRIPAAQAERRDE